MRGREDREKKVRRRERSKGERREERGERREERYISPYSPSLHNEHLPDSQKHSYRGAKNKQGEGFKVQLRILHIWLSCAC